MYIRTIREGIAVTLDELRHHGMDFALNKDTLPDLLRYVCVSNNMFSKEHGSNLSPREVVVGRNLKENHFAAFLSQVIAEIPDSVHEKFPSSSRFIDAFFLFPAWSSQSKEVVGNLIRDGRTYWVRFVAKAIKVVFPLRWNVGAHVGLVKLVEGQGPQELVVDNAARQSFVDDGKGLVLPSPSLRCPATGPPAEWLRQHGFTDGCNACESLKNMDTRKGKVHSGLCCRKYEEWLRKSSQSEGVSEAVVPGAIPSDSRLEESRTISESDLRDFENEFDESAQSARGYSLLDGLPGPLGDDS